jgi:hypothetical protein
MTTRDPKVTWSVISTSSRILCCGCKWWVPLPNPEWLSASIPSKYGKCHRRSPSRPHDGSWWPETLAQDFCGEAQRK